ncbi:MAG: S-layer homology domain-containing protein, partial [Candidatus Ornithomonoglobus sp.]
SDTDITDSAGNAQIKDNNGNLYNVNVSTETKGNIEGAVVQTADGKITVTLPDGTVIVYSDRTTVTVTDRDNVPVAEMPINVKDNKGGDRTEATDADGKAVVPPLSEDYTDKDGNAVINGYTVVVEDTKAKIENAYVEIKDGKISIKLPDTSELTTSNQITVTVTDKDAQPVKDMSVTVTDKNSNTATQSTNADGKITVPVKTSSSGGGSSSGGSSGGGGGGSSSTSTTNVKVSDKDGKSVSVTKSITSDVISLTLPSGTKLDGSNYYTITVTDSKGIAKPDINITLKDKDGNSVSGATDSNGQLTLPAVQQHKAYIEGYEDGTVKPEGNMTRAEAAAIFARNIAERKGESIRNKESGFKDVDAKLWYSSYIAYLEKYDIIEGYDDGTFAPDANITRAEFLAMCTRFYELFADISASKSNSFNDVPTNHWALSYINGAVSMDWIKGYANGSFKPDNKISRAEVVTIVNRVTDREADNEYVNTNMSASNPFTDLTDKTYWAYYSLIEAADDHTAVQTADGEAWIK